MIKKIRKMATVARASDCIDQVVRKMASESRQVAHPGIAVILDEEGKLLGMMTDGDIRRAYANDVDFSHPVSEAMIADPITIPITIPEKHLVAEVIRRVQLDGRHNSEWVRHVLLVDEMGKLVRIVDFLEALQDQNGSAKRVAIFGMGYVGLTLAVLLANRGHQVVGIDVEKGLIEQLNRGLPHVLEPGLKDMLGINLERQKVSFRLGLKGAAQQVYIIAVGTPLGSNGKPDLDALRQVLESIAAQLKRGDHVMLRSTVPVGTTREIVIPYLEQHSNLLAGSDFYVSFAPERTIEGKALDELKSLPQVIGGYSPKCLKGAVEFWSTLTPTVVRMASLEASELVKLANNTFRDISFAFSNELALVADQYNEDAFALVKGANEGYPRNPIPLPSPGVGGYCLTKDPLLFSSRPKGPRPGAILGIASRKINERAALYPIEVIKRYAERTKIAMSEFNVVIMGVAFKGNPETTDIRSSVAIDVLNALRGNVRTIVGWDAVTDPQELERAGFKITDDLAGSINTANVLLILNNHPDNARSEVYQSSYRGRLVFDGWNQLDVMEVEKIPGLKYATMGYMTL